MIYITIWHNGLPGILCVREDEDVAGDQAELELRAGNDTLEKLPDACGKLADVSRTNE